ncbi:hypothetical protein AZI85_12250 [Bdellovibrio bacteriovorus]|uniref:DUF333 domain-containing protein n=1 Tax=Bdellovibrio bacteriovorus TaxID=959 RepID=A0A150WCG6_BDEBC|nr:hypothetical protein AZI85_12250 [Bdellovibrio bacteriovorus]
MFFSLAALCKDDALKLFSPKTNKYEIIKIVTKDGFKISSNCLKSGKLDCLAWKAAKGSLKTPQVGPLIGNPAAKYCSVFDANNRILKDEKAREYDYCVFPDGSMIDAWTLYNGHHK